MQRAAILSVCFAVVVLVRGDLETRMKELLDPHMHAEDKTRIKHDSPLLHDMFDKDGDDHLSKEELVHLLEKAEVGKTMRQIRHMQSQYATDKQKDKFFEDMRTAQGLERLAGGYTKVNFGFDKQEEGQSLQNFAANNMAFDIYDVNNDGMLDEDEFIDYMKIRSRYRELHEAYTKDIKKYSEYLDKIDTNKDDKVTLEEILSPSAPSHPRVDFNRELLFKLCDTDMDGYLDLPEFGCFEDPLPEVKGEYHALGVLAIENFEEGKHAENLDQLLSKNEMKKILGFKKANQMLTAAIKSYHHHTEM